ncbi:DUF697 domain-containing protein [Tautonia marina]|uniref:DUF697 domain-containing protein n=1 Tax=Tautonia marina TaxID=2653855 RepID=UPI001375B579|nr:DUF697 domain-containing protein [Tautonia marina]
MNRTIKSMAVLVSGFILLSFGVVVVNQTAGVVSLASEVHPMLGKGTLVVLLGSYGALIGVPVVLFFRLPKSLDPPLSEDDPDFDGHLDRLRSRLATNPVVTEPELNTRDGLHRAIGQLDQRADDLVKSTASVVFLSTAVSQNGQFDALIVLAAQSRMVWQIAHLYHQRPTVRDMTRLYANVAVTAFAAGAIDEIDLNQQVQPILGSTLGSAAGVIPGMQVAATVLVNSVMSGTANAYLTLRVGLIAKRYCGAIVVQPKPALRRAASAEAARMLGAIVSSGTKTISAAIFGAVRDKGVQTLDGLKQRATSTATAVGSSARGASTRFAGLFRRADGPIGPEAAGG